MNRKWAIFTRLRLKGMHKTGKIGDHFLPPALNLEQLSLNVRVPHVIACGGIYELSICNSLVPLVLLVPLLERTAIGHDFGVRLPVFLL